MSNSSSHLPPPSAQDRAHAYLKSRILSLAYKPGQWLRAQDIASRIGLSRTPVREALSRLEQESFVRRDEGWGYVVCSISIKAARDLYKVREALECEAIKEAIAVIGAPQLRTLDSLLKKAEQARAKRRLADFRANTRAFHEVIARTGDNALLVEMLSQIEDRVQLLGAIVFEKHGERMDEVAEENRGILKALQQGDAALAEAAVRRHVRRAWESYMTYVIEDFGPGGSPIRQVDMRRGSGQTAIR